jgi:hypothetical protein
VLRWPEKPRGGPCRGDLNFGLAGLATPSFSVFAMGGGFSYTSTSID